MLGSDGWCGCTAVPAVCEFLLRPQGMNSWKEPIVSVLKSPHAKAVNDFRHSLHMHGEEGHRGALYHHGGSESLESKQGVEDARFTPLDIV